MNDVLLKNKMFATFNDSDGNVSLSALCRELLDAQKPAWKLLLDNYAFLERSDYRSLTRDGFSFQIQSNPGRIVSAAAKVDPQSIAQRKCFLCLENLPAPQQGILYRQEYLILCNPWPIFPRHFTIAHLKHLPQSIENSFPSLLWAVKDLSPEFTIFYNGPTCGASAPDHLHFQAVPAGSMPIERDVTIHENRLKIHEDGGVSLYKAMNPGRSMIIIEGKKTANVLEVFSHVLKAMQHVLTEQSEPMINIICSYKDGHWMVIIFPRRKFRPSVYFLEGDEKILISPGAVEMGGFIVTPKKNDFEKLDMENIESIFREVSLEDETFKRLLVEIVGG